jgi:hypothetical protein
MFVVKRNGESQPVSFDKITARIVALCEGLDPIVDPVLIAQKVCTINSYLRWSVLYTQYTLLYYFDTTTQLLHLMTNDVL